MNAWSSKRFILNTYMNYAFWKLWVLLQAGVALILTFVRCMMFCFDNYSGLAIIKMQLIMKIIPWNSVFKLWENCIIIALHFTTKCSSLSVSSKFEYLLLKLMWQKIYPWSLSFEFSERLGYQGLILIQFLDQDIFMGLYDWDVWKKTIYLFCPPLSNLAVLLM